MGSFIVGLLIATLAVVGCTGSDEVSQVAIEEERQEAADRLDEQVRELESERDSDEEVELERADDPEPGQSTNSVPSNATACGGGVSAGPNTSCPFAQNVADAYHSSPSTTLRVYSPVTELTYTMTCSSGSPHVCTGGNNASVYFP